MVKSDLRLGFVGPFGDSNFGDYGMLVNDICYFQPKESIVFTYSEEEILEEIKEKYLDGYAVSSFIVRHNYHYIQQYGKKYSVSYDDTELSPQEIYEYISNMEDLRQEINHIDMLIVVGGGYFNRVWAAKHRKGKLISIMAVILAADKAGKKAIFGGNTFGPFDESKMLFKNFFLSLKNAVMAARDDIISIRNMEEIGVRSDVRLLPDDFYFLCADLKRKCDSFTKPQGISRYIVLELYSSMEEIDTWISQIRNFVQTMKQDYQADTILLPLDRMYGGQNQAAFLKQEIPELIYKDFGERSYRSIEEVQGFIRNASFVICQRYHMFLFAMASNVPAITLLKDVCGDKRYYYAKVNGLLRQIFCNQSYEPSLFMQESVPEGIAYAEKNYMQILQQQGGLFNKKKEEAEAMMQERREAYFSFYYNKQRDD